MQINSEIFKSPCLTREVAVKIAETQTFSEHRFIIDALSSNNYTDRINSYHRLDEMSQYIVNLLYINEPVDDIITLLSTQISDWRKLMNYLPQIKDGWL